MPTQDVEGRGDRLRAKDHARTAAVRRVVDRAMATQAPVAEVAHPDRDQALLLDATRDALGERSLEHAGEERQDVDLEGHPGVPGVPGVPGGSASPSRPGRRGWRGVDRCGVGRPRGHRRIGRPASARPSPRCPGSVRVGWMRARLAQVERVGIHDDLAPARREDPDERPNSRQVERADRSAAHDEDLVLGDPIDVLDGPELRAIDASHRRPDHLVPVVGAPGQVLVRPNGRFEVGAPERVRTVARRDLAEPEPPAGAVGHGLCAGQRQRP